MNSTKKNNYGIFINKKAKNLAIKYNLPIQNKTAYMYKGKYIRLYDVQFIVDNLWINHFQYNEPKPIEVNRFEYFDIFNSLIIRFPGLSQYIKLQSFLI